MTVVAASLKHFKNQRFVHLKVLGQGRVWSGNHQACQTYSAAPVTLGEVQGRDNGGCSHTLKHLHLRHWTGIKFGHLVHLAVVHTDSYLPIVLWDQDNWGSPRTGQGLDDVLGQHLVQFLFHGCPSQIGNPIRPLIDWCSISNVDMMFCHCHTSGLVSKD